MPRRIIILIGLFFLASSLSGQGGGNFSESFRNVPLLEVFQQLEQKHQIRFAFDHAAVKDIVINKNLKATDLSAAMNQLFAETGLIYQLVGSGQVLVRKDEVSLGQEELPAFEIRGTVIDSWTGARLPYANVIAANGDGTATDESGYFRINLPATGKHQLTFQYIGYQARSFSFEATASPAPITIRLTPKIEKLPNVVVEERAPVLIQRGNEDQTTLNVQPLSRIAQFVGGKDLFRALQLLPGVNASNDLSADLSVRGSTGDENLVLLDGIPLYNVTHYFGIFSLVNPNAIGQVKLYKNAFPSEYGGRTASVIDMQTLSMERQQFKGQAELNLLTSNALLEVPIGNNMGFMAAGRITNQNLSDNQLFRALEGQAGSTQSIEGQPLRPAARVITGYQPGFQFYDANLKWTWLPSPASMVTASYFRGEDEFDYNFERKIYPPFRRLNVYSQENFLENAEWRNEGLSARWEQTWKPQFKSQATFAASNYYNRTALSSEFARVQDTVRTGAISFSNLNVNEISGAEFNWKNNWEISKGQSLAFGYQFSRNKVELSVGEDEQKPLFGNRQENQHALYTQYQANPAGGKWNIDLGMRFTAYRNSGYLSPRVFVAYGSEPAFKVKASWGIYQQFLRQLFYEDRFGRSFQYWVLSDDRFPIAISHHWMLGANHRNKLFDLDVEFYLKNTDGVLEHARQRISLPAQDGKPVKETFRLFKGSGRTIGMDVLLKKTAGNFSGWAAYTLSKSTYAFAEVFNGQSFPSPLDSRHQLKLIGQYRFGQHLDLAATYIFASGRPYTDLSLLDGRQTDRQLLSPADRIQYLDDYHRVDVAATYAFKLGRADAQAGISLFNLLDRDNVKYRQFIYAFLAPDGNGPKPSQQTTVVGTEVQMLGFTPNLSFQVRF